MGIIQVFLIFVLVTPFLRPALIGKGKCNIYSTFIHNQLIIGSFVFFNELFTIFTIYATSLIFISLFFYRELYKETDKYYTCIYLSKYAIGIE